MECIEKIIKRFESFICLEVARSVRKLFNEHNLYALETFPSENVLFNVFCRTLGHSMGQSMTLLEILIHAQYVPEVEFVKRMLDTQTDPSYQFLHAAGAGMHYAMHDSNLALLKLFFEVSEKPKNLSVYDEKATTAAFAAIQREAFPILKYCVEELRIDVNQVYSVAEYPGYKTMSLLLHACLQNKPKIAGYLMGAGASLGLIITMQEGGVKPLRDLLPSSSYRTAALSLSTLGLLGKRGSDSKMGGLPSVEPAGDMGAGPVRK